MLDQEALRELAAARACGQHTWQDIGKHFGTTKQTVRGQWLRHCKDKDVGVVPCPICGEQKGEPASSWAEQGNYAEGTVQHDDPLSLPEFLKLLQVDTEVWEVREWKASRWQSPINRRGHLDFDKGVLDGSLDYFPGVQDLWSHRATFVRRVPISLAPVVQPVQCSVSYIQPVAGPVGNYDLESALIFGDLHIGYSRDNATGRLTPFHDRQAISLILSVAHLFDKLVIDGDLLDLTNWNDKFLRSPDFYWTTQPAVLEAHWILRQLREANPQAEIVVVPGNHESRISKALQRHLIEAYGLRAADEMHLPPVLSPERLLGLDGLGVIWAEEGEYWLGPVRVSHGEVARKPPGASARAMVEENQCDNIFGHTHRLEMVSKVVRDRLGPRVVKSVSTACLCHTDGRVPGSKAGDNWQKGFVTVDYSEKSWAPSMISIGPTGLAIVRGDLYWGMDYTKQLRHDLPDWNW